MLRSISRSFACSIQFALRCIKPFASHRRSYRNDLEERANLYNSRVPFKDARIAPGRLTPRNPVICFTESHRAEDDISHDRHLCFRSALMPTMFVSSAFSVGRRAETTALCFRDTTPRSSDISEPLTLPSMPRGVQCIFFLSRTLSFIKDPPRLSNGGTCRTLSRFCIES